MQQWRRSLRSFVMHPSACTRLVSNVLPCLSEVCTVAGSSRGIFSEVFWRCWFWSCCVGADGAGGAGVAKAPVAACVCFDFQPFLQSPSAFCSNFLPLSVVLYAWKANCATAVFVCSEHNSDCATSSDLQNVFSSMCFHFAAFSADASIIKHVGAF